MSAISLVLLLPDFVSLTVVNAYRKGNISKAILKSFCSGGQYKWCV
jgi:hypothetical protein